MNVDSQSASVVPATGDSPSRSAHLTLRRIFVLGAWLLLVLAAYVSVFSYWWLHSPATSTIVGGKQVRAVEFRFNTVSWYTQPLWLPAFWFVEHVCGYEFCGFAPMGKDSVIEYAK